MHRQAHVPAQNEVASLLLFFEEQANSYLINLMEGAYTLFSCSRPEFPLFVEKML